MNISIDEENMLIAIVQFNRIHELEEYIKFRNFFDKLWECRSAKGEKSIVVWDIVFFSIQFSIKIQGVDNKRSIIWDIIFSQFNSL